MHANQTTLCAEPTIGELLASPITRAAMRADGLDPVAFERMLGAVADHLRVAAATTQPRATARGAVDWFLSADRRWPDRKAETMRMRSLASAAVAKSSNVACGTRCGW